MSFPAKGPGVRQVPALVIAGVKSRPCGDGDIPFLRQLYRSTRADELAAFGWDEAFGRTFCDRQFEAQHRDWTQRFPQADFLLLLEADQPVGRLYVGATDEAVRLIDISLVPAARGRGLGTAVIGAVIVLAAAAGKPVALSVDPMNPRAAALYRRLGFTETGRDAARIHMCRPLAGAADR